jgi:hypothetical protein
VIIAGSDRVGDTDPTAGDMGLNQEPIWDTADNAPFRVVSSTSQLVSAPIDHFDGALLVHVSSEPKPMTAVIAEVMAAQPCQTVDYMLQQRLIALESFIDVIRHRFYPNGLKEYDLPPEQRTG